MNLIFVMSISGSIIFLLYLFSKPIANRYLTAHWQYNFLKVCLLFYLLPYQCFQNKLLILYNLIFGTGEATNPLRGDFLTFEAKNTIYITTDGKLHYKYWLPLLILCILWLCIVTILLYWQIKKYRSCRNKLLLVSETSDTEAVAVTEENTEKALPDRAKQVQIMFCPFIKSPFTIGVFRPVIVLPKQNKTEDLSLYLSHELNHIKNHDAFWKLIALITILLHWYNPLVYLLFYELCVVCEKNCDEIVTETLNDAQKMHYEDLIIEAARHQTDIRPLFANTFSTNKKHTKERILFLTRKNRKFPCQKIITAFIVCIASLSLPISVLAYQPVMVYPNAAPYDISPRIGDMYIIPDGTPSPFEEVDTLMQLDFTLSDEIIIDEHGRQYALTAEIKETARSCPHKYINTTKSKHEKSGNGCTTYTYEGTYCTSCGSCLQENLVGQTILTQCPH